MTSDGVVSYPARNEHSSKANVGSNRKRTRNASPSEPPDMAQKHPLPLQQLPKALCRWPVLLLFVVGANDT